ncbi:MULTISPECIES: lytic transglycosylase domain-containing protein [Psychrobacter]|uniref:lytic transglycosylase domain-containing protein n=1 Tax=Psychrobacter TaxID=497 RepID=UPI00146CB5E7|nr:MULTISPECIES: lytic transglycosylase domain-containing protein [Psychrobacter]
MITVAPLFRRYLPSALMSGMILATAATSSQAANINFYKNRSGQTLITNSDNPQGSFSDFNRKVKTTYYKDSIAQKATFTSNYNPTYTPSTSSGSRSTYDSYIVASAGRHGVDPALLKAMMHTESAFNPNARSPVGAQGLMQLMPATARRFSVSNPWNPAENIEGSAKYLAWLLRKFNNKVEFAVAGYNAGEGNVMKYGGIPPFKETRNYVQRVMSRYNTIYKNDAGLFANNSRSSNSGSYSATPVSYATSSNSASYANAAYNALR